MMHTLINSTGGCFGFNDMFKYLYVLDGGWLDDLLCGVGLDRAPMRCG